MPAELPLPIRAPDPHEELFKQLFEQRCRHLLQSTIVPIFAANNNSASKVGSIFVVNSEPISEIATGSLFTDKGKRYLVTAAHVLRDFNAEDKHIRIAMGDPARPKPLPCFPENTEVNDALDIGVVLLPPQVSMQLVDAKYIRSDMVAQMDTLEEANYLLFGHIAERAFPNSDFTELHVPKFGFWTKPLRKEIAARSFNQSAHVLVEYGSDGMVVKDGDLVKTPVSLGGMSGSNLWRIFTLPELEPDQELPMPMVVAVENMVYDTTTVRCTLWKHVLPLIESLANRS